MICFHSTPTVWNPTNVFLFFRSHRLALNTKEQNRLNSNHGFDPYRFNPLVLFANSNSLEAGSTPKRDFSSTPFTANAFYLLFNQVEQGSRNVGFMGSRFTQSLNASHPAAAGGRVAELAVKHCLNL